MRNKISVLITGVPEKLSKEFLQPFLDLGTHVEIVLIGTGDYVGSLGQNTTHIKVVPNNLDEYLPLLKDIISQYEITDIVPCIDSEVAFFCENRAVFSPLVRRLWINRAHDANACIDKYLTYQRVGEECPKSILLSDSIDIDSALESLGYPEMPVVVRPSTGPNGSGKGFRIICRDYSSGREMFYRSVPSRYIGKSQFHHAVLSAKNDGILPPLLLSEYLPGDEFSCYVLCDRGNLLMCGIHAKLEHEVGTTNTGFAKFVENVTVREFCCKISKILELDLINNIQVKCDHFGRPKLVEVNPRIAGTIALTQLNGINLIGGCFDLLNGEELAEVTGGQNEKESLAITRKYEDCFSRIKSLPLKGIRCGKTTDFKLEETVSDVESLLMAYDNIVFDLDNTLIDELHFLKCAVIEFARRMKCSEWSIKRLLVKFEEYYKQFGNDRIYDRCLADLFGGEGLEMFLGILRVPKSEESVKFLPGRRALLERLVAGGKKLLLLTDGNKLQQSSKVHFAEMHKYISFENTFYAIEHGGKPLLGRKSLFTEQELNRSILVGDSNIDLLTAKNFNIDFLRLL